MSDDETGSTGGRPDDVGPLADEAARLAGAFAAWAARNTAGVGQHAHDLAGTISHGVRDAWHEADAHLATGSEQCTVCPVCRTVAAVREVSPEVRTHLVQAAGSLIAAASGLLATFTDGAAAGATAAGATDTGAATGPGVETIDLDPEDTPGDA
jgi:hypothetical protein